MRKPWGGEKRRAVLPHLKDGVRAVAMLVWCIACLLGCGEREPYVPPEVAPGDYRRIISLTPSVTEILFALDAGDRLVGVTSWCDYPEAAKALPRVGDFLEPNLEAVLTLAPDLIILAPTGSLLRKQYDNLLTFDLKVLVVWNNTLEETFSAIRTIGSTIRMDAPAAALVDELRKAWRSGKARFGKARGKRVLWVVGYRPLVAVGEGTYQAELLEAAGGINVIPKGRGGWPAINEEFVIETDPEVIIDSAMGGEDQEAGTDVPRFWSRFPAVEAVREGRIRVRMEDALYRPGPRMAEALNIIGEAIHPGYRR